MARERRIRRQVLSVAEEILLLAAAKDHLRAMIIAALDTGMRRGEITSQLWEDIDFSRKLLFVTRSKTPEGESREIPLTERLQVSICSNRPQGPGLVINFPRPPGPHRQAHVADRAEERRSAPHPLPRSPPHLQHSPDGGGRPAGNSHGAHGPFLGLESAFDVHPHRASGQARSPSGNCRSGSTSNRSNSTRSMTMPAPKTTDPKPAPAPKPEGRKVWKKKTPVEVVLEQADKLKAEIAEMEEELKAKRRQLQKFEEAKKLFEGM
jgi:hypothetical protein